MTEQQTHLDRAEKFAEWLETQRIEAGVERRELYDRNIVSESFYTKLVTIGNTRRKHGDRRAEAIVPRTESRVLIKVLEYIAKTSGKKGLVAEGLSILGLHHEEIEEMARFNESAERLGRIMMLLPKLRSDDLRTIDEIVNRFAMLI